MPFLPRGLVRLYVSTTVCNKIFPPPSWIVPHLIKGFLSHRLILPPPVCEFVCRLSGGAWLHVYGM